MGKWGYANKLLKGAASKSADDFPAIRKLLEKEKAKEARFGTNNPSIKLNERYNLGTKKNSNIVPEQNAILDNFFDIDDGQVGEMVFTDDIGKFSDWELPTVYSGDEGLFVRSGFYSSDDARRIKNKLNEQPIFWADDATKTTPKLSAIEDALIRERERERIWNTNNPVIPIARNGIGGKEPPVVFALGKSGLNPGGNMTFETKKLIPKNLSEINTQDLISRYNRQLEGLEFFNPVNFGIESSHEGVRTAIGNKLKKYGQSKRNLSSEAFTRDIFDYIAEHPNVFFADGSTI
jgi:hypothetical protein